MTYAIRFDFPESDTPLFAGLHKGAFGWAPTLRTALLFDDAESAERARVNAYGESGKWGRVITVREGVPV